MATMRTLRRLGILLFLFLPLCSLFGRTYYVSTSGSDSRTGSISDPWRTLAYAGNHVFGGDTLYVRGGVYHEKLVPGNSGTANAYIVFSAYPGEDVQIDGPLDGSHEVINVWQKYIIIQGFNIKDQDFLKAPGKPAYWVVLTGQDIIFRRNRLVADGNAYQNMYTYNEQSRGIDVEGTRITVENCFVRGLDFGIVVAGASPRYATLRYDTVYATNVSNIAVTSTLGKSTAYHGTLIEYCVLDTSFTEDNIQFEDDYTHPLDTQYNRGTIVRNNRCGNAAENAIDMKGTERIVIENNLLYSSSGDDNGILDGHDKYSGSGLTSKSPGSATRLTLVRYNVIYDNLSGVTMTEGDIFYNNTILNNRRTWEGPNQADNTLFGIVGTSEGGANRIVVNNIIGGQPNRAMLEWTMDGSGSGFYMNNNLYYDGTSTAKFLHRVSGTYTTTTGLQAWKSILSSYSGYSYIGGKDVNSVEAEPQFVNANVFPVGYDPGMKFDLQSTSPAVDAGRSATTTTSSGTNTVTLVVENAGAFCDGFGITQGDIIKIGGANPVRITGIDYSNNRITLAEARSWDQGVGVHVAFEGKAPDIGARESSSSNVNVQPPATPWLQSPSLGASDVALDVALAWDAIATAESYDLQVSTVSDFQTTVIYQTGLPAPTSQARGLTGGTTYYWRVRARNTAGASSWSLSFSFSTKAVSVPKVPGLLAPANGSTGTSTGLTLSWESLTEATSYELNVATASDFSNSVVAQSGITQTQYVLQGLVAGSTYFWRVRGSNDGGTGSWSTTFSFTTQSAGPSIPRTPGLLSPASGATDVAPGLTLTWETITEATSYDLDVATSTDFSSPAVTLSGITEARYAVQGLDNGAKYYWRVRGRNVAGAGAWSVVFSFTTSVVVAIPRAPSLLSPPSGTTEMPLAVTLSWEYSTDASSYLIQVATSQDFASPLIAQSGITGTNYSLRNLAYNTTYYWRLRATNSAGTGDWSQKFLFTTAAETVIPTLPPVVLAAPGAGATGLSTNPTLGWNAISGAISYMLQVGEEPTFATPAVDLNGLTGTSRRLDGLKTGTTYYWRVAGFQVGMNSAWSSVQSFSTFALPAMAASNAVSNGGFSDGIASWAFEGSGAFASAGPGYDDGQAAKVFIAQPTGNERLLQDGVVLKPDSTYLLTFAASCTNAHGLSVALVSRDDASMDYGLPNMGTVLGTAWKMYGFTITPRNFTSPVNNGRLEFNFGGYATAGDLYSIDQVRLRTIDPNNPPPIDEPSIPTAYALEQNFPNPFNPRTTIVFSLPADAHVSLKLYDLLGREVRTLIDEVRTASSYEVPVNMEGLASGMYIYRLVSGGFQAVKRMMYVK
jgi:hypothetical protein